MPIYEYQCESCGNKLEKIQKISDPPLTDCPECSKPALKKLVSASSFRLKGSGWYETDFKDKKKPDSKGGGGSTKVEGTNSTKSGDKKETSSSQSGESKKTGTE